MKSKGEKSYTLPALFWGAWLLSFVIIAHYGTLDFTCGLFMGLSAVSYFCVFMKTHSMDGGGKRSKRMAAALWFIAVCYAFGLFGRSIFMQQARFEYNIQRIVSFCILVPALYPTTPGILAVMEKLTRKEYIHNPVKKNRNTGIICGLLILAVDLLLTSGYYPCTMTWDSVIHWRNATGIVPLTDYHPIAFTLLLKGLIALVNAKTPYIYVVFQVAVLSVVIGNLAAFLSRRGLSQKVLIFGTVIFAFCPSTYMLCLYLSKNPLSAILSLELAVCFAEIIVEPEYYSKKWFWYIKTVLTAAAVFLVRQNNMVIIVPLVLMCVWLMVRHRETGRRFLIVLGGAACIIGLMEGVVIRNIEYTHADKSHETIRPLLASVGSALQQDLPLPEEVTKTAERVLPLSEWKSRYSQFNSDELTWTIPKPNYSAVRLSEGFSVFFRMLARYPDVVIKDRMDGMNLIWDIRDGMDTVYRCPEGVLAGADFKDEVFLPEGLPGKVNMAVKSIAESLFRISSDEGILDVFVWKNGIYVYLLLVTAVFLAKHKKKYLLWVAAPGISILLTYVLVLAWQMYFYIWFFPLAVLLLIILSIVEGDKKTAAQACQAVE